MINIRILWRFCLYSIVFVLFVAGMSCTKNPFTEKDIVSIQRTIQGTVALSDDASPESVFVWIEGFDVATFTDAEGKFQIDISFSTPTNNRGLFDGVYRLFFYVANYQLTYINVVIKDGDVSAVDGDTNNDNQIDQVIRIPKLLDINVTVTPKTISLAEAKPFTVTVELRSVSKAVQVYYPGVVSSKILPMIFIEQNTGEAIVLESTIAGVMGDEAFVLSNDTYRRQVVVNAERGQTLNEGVYQIIPYLLIEPDTIPPDMLFRLGTGPRPDPEVFHLLPIRVDGDTFTVTP